MYGQVRFELIEKSGHLTCPGCGSTEIFMLKKLLIAALFGTAVLASAEQPAFELKISKPVLNKTIPSGSGMVPYKDGFLVVGDDSADLYAINQHFKLREKSQIKAYQSGRRDASTGK